MQPQARDVRRRRGVAPAGGRLPAPDCYRQAMPTSIAPPRLPDGIVVVVKEECATCHSVASVLRQLDEATTLTVYTQDDPRFPESPVPVHDADLSVSWHHGIETVPTVIRIVDGIEAERTVGWHRDEWIRVTGIDGLGADLPAMRPGCGSMSVDPDLVDELNVRFGASMLASRRIDVAEAEDEMELMFTRGWTDGLPVVPPTEARVMRMLTGTTRAPSDIVATVPPDLVDVTVEKGRGRSGDGRVPARVPALGAHRCRDRLYQPSSTCTACWPRRCRSDRSSCAAGRALGPSA